MAANFRKVAAFREMVADGTLAMVAERARHRRWEASLWQDVSFPGLRPVPRPGETAQSPVTVTPGRDTGPDAPRERVLSL